MAASNPTPAVYQKVSSVFTDDGTIVIPGGNQVISIVVKETAGAAMTTQMRIGTTSGGAEMRAAASVTASFLLAYAASSAVNCCATDTTVYVNYAKKTVTGITQANPAVVSSTSHGFSNGQKVKLTNVVGMTEVNGNTYTAANVGANSFELSGIDSTGFTAYVSGGSAGGFGDASVTLTFQIAQFD